MKTKFHTDGEVLDSDDPQRSIVITPVRENQYPTARATAAAFWISYFALHWLLLLEVVEFTVGRAGATIFFLAAAILVTILIAASEVKKK